MCFSHLRSIVMRTIFEFNWHENTTCTWTLAQWQGPISVAVLNLQFLLAFRESNILFRNTLPSLKTCRLNFKNLQLLLFISQNHNYFITKYQEPTTFVTWSQMLVTQYLYELDPPVMHTNDKKVICFC
jgi:hypothetical protein